MKSLLQTTTVVKGQKAVELNKAIKDYQKGLALEKDAKALKERSGAIIKSICTEPVVYETNTFTQSMTFYKGSVSIDLKKLKEDEPETYEALLEKYPNVTGSGIRIGKATLKSGLTDREV